MRHLDLSDQEHALLVELLEEAAQHRTTNLTVSWVDTEDAKQMVNKVIACPEQDWKKIAVEAICALGQCCGCSITGGAADVYLEDHLTKEEHEALVAAWFDAGLR